MPRRIRAVLLLALLAPAAAAETEWLLADPPGDVRGTVDASVLPCAPAIDIVGFRAVWLPDAVQLEYQVTDLSVVEEYALIQDVDGRCVYSYTDFEADIDGREWADSVYFDYVDSPIFGSGWRFLLHEDGRDLDGAADLSANTITIVIPSELLGNPGPGDRFGNFSVAAITAAGGAGYDRESDHVPDSRDPCECWLTYPAPAGAVAAAPAPPVQVVDTDDVSAAPVAADDALPSEEDAASPLPLLAAVLALGVAGRLQR